MVRNRAGEDRPPDSPCGRWVLLAVIVACGAYACLIVTLLRCSSQTGQDGAAVPNWLQGANWTPKAKLGHVEASTAAIRVPVAKYGFYVHAFRFPAAVLHLVVSLKRFFPGSPVYVMSDGGMSFERICSQENCTFVHCPPANDRWHPWPFFRRLLDGTIALNTEYVILLEPDTTVHGPITRPPSHAAGGLPVSGRSYGGQEIFEAMGRKRNASFVWSTRDPKPGFCGGSYFRTDAILDAMTDEAIDHIDWNWLGESFSKEVFSSDFAIAYVLAARGWDSAPWDDSAQYESPEAPKSGLADAAFRHHGAIKPTYEMRLSGEQETLKQDIPALYAKFETQNQLCWDLRRYVERFGSYRCANRHPFHYSERLRLLHP